jgi:hypothetical protein
MSLRRLALVCHVLLMAALAASVLTAPTVLRLAVAVLLVLPLLLTVPGLAAERRTIEKRLAVLLVAYIGGASVEVIAQSGRLFTLSAALLLAALELGLLLALTRRRDARE